MAQVTIQGDVRIGVPYYSLAIPTVGGGITIDADTEEAAFMFQIPKAGTITDVGFRFSTPLTSKLDLTIALETVGTDGLPSGTNYGGSTPGTKAATDGDYVANTVCNTALGTSATAVAPDIVALRITPITGTVNIKLSELTVTTNGLFGYPRVYADAGAGFVADNFSVPQVYLKYSDGSFVTPVGCYPPGDIGESAIQDDSDPDEIGWKFIAPAAMTFAGLYQVLQQFGSTADVVISIYDSTPTLLSSVTFTHDKFGAAKMHNHIQMLDVLLTKDAVYYVTFKSADTASDFRIATYTVDNSNYFNGFAGGPNFHFASRNNGGAFSATTTKKPFGGLLFSKIDDGAGGGGGVKLAGRGGGMVG